MERYRPKERTFIEQWLRENEGKTGIKIIGGKPCCYGLGTGHFAWVRQLCGMGALYFTRKKEGEYIDHTIDNKEQTWYIYDELMEEIPDGTEV